jgi:hypothetical protein
MTLSSNSQNTVIVRQLIILAVFTAGVLVTLNMLGVFSERRDGGHSVTFKLEGSASNAKITYTMANGKSSGPLDVTLPWKKTVHFSQPTTVILTAGNQNQTGSIRCYLLLDGQDWKHDQSAMPNDKVSCAGIVP